MTVPIIIDLAVAEGDDAHAVSLPDAVRVAGAAASAGVAALRILDGPGLLDPSVVVGYLAGHHPDLGYLAEIPTTHQAPYNVARRVLSLDRATHGRIGVALVAGEGDEVSQAVAPDPSATDPALRWAEYADIVTRLWESFPADALVGDQERAVVVEVERIRPVGHAGSFYRVAGPLDGPSSVQGRPLLVGDLGTLAWPALAAVADVVRVGPGAVPGARAALAAALEATGRDRGDVLVAGVFPPAGPVAVPDAVGWAVRHELDVLELRVDGGAAAVLDVIGQVARSRAVGTPADAGGTLRGALGLAPVVRRVAA